jgi:AcrR family transcriptional regulator
MGISERKERAKTELRQTIIEAAKQLFVADGYEKTTIRNIADKIEYSPATIYLHFTDKDDLLFSVHEVAFMQFFEALAPCMLIANPRERLLNMGQIYVQFAYQNPELYGLMFMDTAPMNRLNINDEKWVCGQKTHELLTHTVNQCFTHEPLSTHQLDIITMSIWSYIHGITSLGIRDRFCVINEYNQDLHTLIADSIQFMLDRFIPNTNNGK